MTKPSILFLCTGNSARSQLGESLMRYYAGEQFDVYSAGIEPKGINTYTRRVLAEVGLDMAGQYSKDVNEYLGKINFTYVIAVCGHADANCPVILIRNSQRLFWPFDDPAAAEGDDAEKLAKFRTVRNQIDTRIRAWLGEQGIITQPLAQVAS